MLLPPLRLGCVLRGSARRYSPRALVPRSCRHATRGAQVSARHADPGVDLRDRRGPHPCDRLHAAPWCGAGHRADRGGSRRRGQDPIGARDPLRLREDRAVGAARRSRSGCDRRARCTLPPNADGGSRRGDDHGVRICSDAGRADPVRVDVVPVPRGVAGRNRPGTRAERRRGVLARVGVPVYARRRLPRGDPRVAAAVEGTHVRPHRRDSGGADDVPSRVDRWCAELGLPLLLAARHDADAHGDDPGRVSRRGGGLAPMAPPGDRRRPGGRADHVRAGRRAPPRGARPRMAPGLRTISSRSGSATPPPSSSSSTSTAR